MTNKNLHEDSSCPIDQDDLEESSENILDEDSQNPINGFSEFNNDDYFELIFPTIDYEPHYSP